MDFWISGKIFRVRRVCFSCLQHYLKSREGRVILSQILSLYIFTQRYCQKCYPSHAWTMHDHYVLLTNSWQTCHTHEILLKIVRRDDGYAGKKLRVFLENSWAYNLNAEKLNFKLNCFQSFRCILREKPPIPSQTYLINIRIARTISQKYTNSFWHYQYSQKLSLIVLNQSTITAARPPSNIKDYDFKKLEKTHLQPIIYHFIVHPKGRNLKIGCIYLNITDIDDANYNKNIISSLEARRRSR